MWFRLVRREAEAARDLQLGLVEEAAAAPETEPGKDPVSTGTGTGTGAA